MSHTFFKTGQVVVMDLLFFYLVYKGCYELHIDYKLYDVSMDSVEEFCI